MSSVVSIESLNKYYGDFHALKDISFEVKKGDIFGYLGHNGSGKTTTIKILLGLMKPTSGNIEVLGENTFLDTDESKKSRSKLGAVLDFDGLIHEFSGLKNLTFWGGLYGINEEKALSTAKKLIKLVKLGNWEDVKVSKYSNGMKKRLCIARSLIPNPELLILDEPTSGLDPESRVLIRKILKNLTIKDKTIFISSHDLEEVQKTCSHIGILNKGELILNTSLDKLQIDSNDFKNFSLEETYLNMI
ncbi:MAG: ABC transporter ATP-binding protein [Methanobrevibacter sp.]|jgi:ABC-2 type transport system ATP-binding protein|nr:ABC transporter ATP-binding protein [Candidatus Methanovirga basalitermitum]